MKLTVEIHLTKEEVAGIRAYLKDVSGEDHVSAEDIIREVRGYVSGTLHSPREAVSDYVSKFENKKRAL